MDEKQVNTDKVEDICLDCGRPKAHSFEDISVGLCPKWFAIRDQGAEDDCVQHTAGRQWWENFKGRCVACHNAVPSTRKNEMLCQCSKAWNRGLPSRPGGTKFDEPVHKLYGCVYYAR